MRILVNGYLTGGNCPPFVKNLKEFGVEVKLIDTGIISTTLTNYSDLLERTDIIQPSFNYFIYFTNYILRKLRRKRRIGILAKYKKIVREYNPDIIVNHKADYRASIMLNTLFCPQLTYIYGSEIKDTNIYSDTTKTVFERSDYILTSTAQTTDYIISIYPGLLNKIEVVPLGVFNAEIINKFNPVDISKLRKKYNFLDKDVIIFDIRSLRGEDTGIFKIIKAFHGISRSLPTLKLILVKGFLGNDKIVNQVTFFIQNNEVLKDRIHVFESELSENEIHELLYLSNSFISLLPSDQFGLSIMEAILFKKSLILSDLKVYHDYLGDMPYYIKNQNESDIAKTFKIIATNTPKQTDEVIVNKFIAEFDYKERTRSFISFAENILK